MYCPHRRALPDGVPEGMSRLGQVYLVGAGPGSPDLITVRGLRLLRAADVVAHDALIHPDLLAEIRPELAPERGVDPFAVQATGVAVGGQPGAGRLRDSDRRRAQNPAAAT